MGLLVNVAEVREAMNNVQFSPGQQQHVERVIKGLERQLRTYLRTPLVPEDVTAERAWVDGQGYATVKVTPINQITTIELDSELFAGTQPLDGEFKVTGNSIYVGWPYSHQHVVVTYNGGPDHTENEDMKLAIIDVAVRSLAAHHDPGRTVRGLEISADDESSNPQNLPKRFTPEELEDFVNHRRPYGL